MQSQPSFSPNSGPILDSVLIQSDFIYDNGKEQEENLRRTRTTCGDSDVDGDPGKKGKEGQPLSVLCTVFISYFL